MNNLEKILTKEGENSTRLMEAEVEDIKLLLENAGVEERQTLRSIGLDNDIKIAEAKTQDIIIRREGAARFDRKVVTLKEIEKLCLVYNLRMHPARRFIGTIPPSLGAELNRFCKEKRIALSSHNSYSRFFIIGPPKVFNNHKSIGEIAIESLGTVKKERELRLAEEKRMREDPILVYRLEGENDYFAIIKSWGEDFTPARRVRAFFTKPAVLKFINFSIAMAFLYFLISVNIDVWQWALAKDSLLPEDNQGGWLAFAYIVNLVSIIIYCIYSFNTELSRFRSLIIEKLSNTHPINLE